VTCLECVAAAGDGTNGSAGASLPQATASAFGCTGAVRSKQEARQTLLHIKAELDQVAVGRTHPRTHARTVIRIHAASLTGSLALTHAHHARILRRDSRTHADAHAP
jgi:hypothetical protein